MNFNFPAQAASPITWMDQRDRQTMDVAKMQMEKQLRDAQIQELMEKARREAEMQPYDIEYKRAMTQELLDRANKVKTDKPYDLARAGTEQRNQALPALAIAAENPEAFAKYVAKFDPEAAQVIMSSKDPSAAAKTYLEEARRSSTPYGRLLGAETRADATRNTAELNFHASKYRSDAMLRAKEISAAAAKSGQAAPSVDKLYAQIVIDDMKNGKLTQEQGAEALLNFRSAPQISKPNAGITTEVKPGGGIGLTNKPQPAAPSYPPGGSQQPDAQPVPTSDFDTKWKTLKKGEKLVGPDGKTYVKK